MFNHKSGSKPNRFFYLALGALTLVALTLALSPATHAAPADSSFVVNSAADDPDADTGDGVCRTSAGVCTLRAAIMQANASGGTATIHFHIRGRTLHTIHVGESCSCALPAITVPVTLDGYTQPGASPNTLADGDNAVLLIELDGTHAGGDASGLTIRSSDNSAFSTVRGLVINRFQRDGIVVQGDWNSVEGNFIGTNASGDAALGNGDNGISLTYSSNNFIGGTNPDQRNLISGNPYGVHIANSKANTVLGNFIGTDKTGTHSVSYQYCFASNCGTASGNALSGIFLESTSRNQIGGTHAGARNIISGNGNGITIDNQGGNQILGNYIGTDVTGTNPLGNGSNGIGIFGSAQNVIGGGAGGANRIAHNGINGITIMDVPNGGHSAANLIGENSIFDNGGVGIDLNNDGVTPNDHLDADSGPNDLLNYPVFKSVTIDSGGTHVRGSLDSTPNSSFEIRFYSNPACDPSGFGEGKRYLGYMEVTTNDRGRARIAFDQSGIRANHITATATFMGSNYLPTSEFSRCVDATTR